MYNKIVFYFLKLSKMKRKQPFFFQESDKQENKYQTLKRIKLGELPLGQTEDTLALGSDEGSQEFSDDSAPRLAPDLTLASSLANYGNANEALKRFNAALEEEPDNVSALSHRGDIYIQQGNLDKALADFSKVLALAPDNGLAVRRVVDIYRYKDKPNDLVNVLSEFIALNQDVKENPSLVIAQLELGELYIEQRNLKEALATINKVLTIGLYQEFAFKLLAKIYERQGNHDKAVDAWTKIVDFEENIDFEENNEYQDLDVALLHRGRLYFEQQKFEPALYDFNRLIVSHQYNNPSNNDVRHYTALSYRGAIFQHLALQEAALNDLEKVVENINVFSSQSKVPAFTYLSRCKIFIAQSDYSKAEDDLGILSKLPCSPAQALEREKIKDQLEQLNSAVPTLGLISY